jgi:hypothetical protein
MPIEARVPASQRIFAVQMAASFAYLVALAVGMHLHAMWRDEVQAWLIVRDSSDIAGLFHNLRYEGHPALYYLALWSVAQVLGSMSSLHVVQFTAAAAVAFMLIWVSPFTLVERVLLPFGAFPLFEYGIKSRSYSLGLLILLLVCQVWPQRARRPILIGVLLALLGNVHVLFALIGSALVGAAILERLLQWRARRAFGFRLADRKEIFAVGVFGFGVMLALFTASPPADSGIVMEHGQLEKIARTIYAFSGMVGEPWHDPRVIIAASFLGIATSFLATWTFLKECYVVIFFASSILGLTGFFYMVYLPYAQHTGLIFSVFVAAAWLSRANTRSQGLPGRAGWMPAVWAVQACFGVALLIRSTLFPFSNGAAAAEFIRSHGWAEQPIAALADLQASTVVGYLNVAHIFYIPGKRDGSFIVFDKARLRTVPRDTLQLGEIASTCPLTVLADKALSLGSVREFGLKLAADVDGSSSGEDYLIYRRECPGS